MENQTNQAKTNKTDEKNAIRVSNVATLDTKNPIPFEPTGDSNAFHVVGKKSKRYIPFLAPKDNFFQLLLEAKLLSPTNNSCVNSKADFCTGNGLIFNDAKEDQFYIDWAKRVNKKGETFNSVCKFNYKNIFSVGNSFVEIVRIKVGSTRRLLVFPREFLDCRLSEPDEDDIPRSVFVSKKFRRKGMWTLVDDEAVELPIYYGDDNMPWYVSESGTEHCIIHLKNKEPGYEYYGIPSNIASLPQQILEYRAAKANLDDFDNNMVIGGIVVLEGNMSQEEANKVGREIIATHTGDGKRGRWTVVAGGNKGLSGSKIQSFDTKKEGSYLELDDKIESKIIDSNNWDSCLYGQHKTTGMGNGGFAYLSAVFETKNKTVIQPMQAWMMENFVKVVFHMHDYWVGTKWSDFDMKFETVSPVSFAGLLDVNALLTVDEGREILGKPALKDTTRGGQTISNGKSKGNVQNQPA